jgi:hypothetical protein
MQINARSMNTFRRVRIDGALRAAVLTAACLLAQLGVSVAGTEATNAVAGSPAKISPEAKAQAAPTAKVNSKSPYAAWRAQHEQAEAPDTSGHGHRAPLPEGQTHPRRAPQ